MMGKMNREIRELSKQFGSFMKENKWVLWIVMISVIVSYGISLSGLRIGIDTEANLNRPDEFLGSWYSIGRFSLVFTKNLSGLRLLNPMLANILMLAMMVCYGLFADFMFYVFSGNDRRMKVFYLIFPALFLTHPVYAQQFIFSVQVFEVALCMLIGLFSVYAISRWAFEGKRGFLAVGLLTMVWSFGGYQAIVPFYMAAALAVYLIYYYFHDGQVNGFYLKASIRCGASFLVGYALYRLVVKVVLLWQKGFGFQDVYLEDQVRWATEPVSVCIGTIKHYMGEVILGRNVFYTKTFFLFSLLFCGHLLYRWVKGKRREYILYGAAALALVLSPFYLAFYQGSMILMRSQLCLPYTAAFFWAAAVTFIVGERKNLAAALTAVCLLLSFNQGTTTSRALFSAQMAYEHDKMVAGQLIASMQTLDAAYHGQKIAMIGQYHPVLPEAASIREETIGYSFFEWDFMEDLGVTKRGTGFLKTLGYPFEPASQEEYDAAKQYSITMPDWPAKGSVQKLGDVVVIRFSGAYD